MNEWQLMSVTPPVGVPIELRVHPEYERINPLVRQWRRVQPAPAAEREPIPGETVGEYQDRLRAVGAAGVVADARLDMCLERIQALETRLPPLKDLERRVSNISDTLMSLDERVSDSVQQLGERLDEHFKRRIELGARVNTIEDAMARHCDAHRDTDSAVEHQSEPPQCVRDLLAVIHRDGGDYLAEHGLWAACHDAETAVTRLLHRTGRRDLLASAIELREGWQQKALGAQEQLAQANAQLDWLCTRVARAQKRWNMVEALKALPTTRDAIDAAMKEEG